jgi:PAS domain S-box-containing protein
MTSEPATELRETGISVVGEMPWGTHFCHFYETKDDLLDILIPFFRTGLENNEFCVWLVFEPFDEEEARAAVRADIPDGDRRLSAGDIEIIPHTEWCLSDGQFDMERVITSWEAKLAQALQQGYSGMRVNCNGVWLTENTSQALSEYETWLHEMIAGQRMLVLCSYPLALAKASEIFDIAHEHQFAIARRYGEWDIVETPELRQTKREITRLNVRLEHRVAERTRELETRNQELIREIAERRRAEGELTRKKEILQKIFDQIPLMISFFDAEGRLELVNREWERLRGWSLAELQDQNMDILAASYPDPEDLRRVQDFIEESNGEWKDFKIRVRDGRLINTSIAYVRLSDGTLVSIGQDITERKRTEERLRATSEQLRALTASLTSAREEEGIRIAREIHDELGSVLTSLRWELENLDGLVSEFADSTEQQILQEKIEVVMDLTDTTIGVVRRIASELRPSVLDDLGLVEAIEWQAQQFQARTGITCNCGCSLEGLELSQEQSTAVFRIFQESLTNIIRHAQATHVEVRIMRDDGNFVLTVTDNGRGISDEEKSGPHSLGLLGMRERAHLIGGEIDITGTPGIGTEVTVRVPIPGNNENSTRND